MYDDAQAKNAPGHTTRHRSYRAGSASGE